MAIEQDAPADDTQAKIDAAEARIDPKNDYSSFLGADDYQAAKATKDEPKHAPVTQPAAPRQPAPPASSKEKAEPKPELPEDLVAIAKNLGFEDDELDSFQGDGKALSKTIQHLLRNHRDKEEEVEKPKAKKDDDDGFDLEKFEKGEYDDPEYQGSYDPGVVRLAKHVKSLEAKLAKYEELAPLIEQDIRERQQERGRAAISADLKAAGIDPDTILKDDKKLNKGVHLIRNLMKAYQDVGAEPPKPSELWKTVLPLVGVAGSSPPQADDRPTDQSKDGDLTAQQKAALERQRNPMNGRFTAEPVHRGGGNGKGDPLRSYLLDNGVDPGPTPAEMTKEGFL